MLNYFSHPSLFTINLEVKWTLLDDAPLSSRHTPGGSWAFLCCINSKAGWPPDVAVLQRSRFVHEIEGLENGLVTIVLPFSCDHTPNNPKVL